MAVRATGADRTVLIVLASIALAGGWRRVTRPLFAPRRVGTLLLLWLVPPQIPGRSKERRYGVLERHAVNGHSQFVVAEQAGSARHADERTDSVRAGQRPRRSTAERQIQVDGSHVATADIVPAPSRKLDYLWSQPGTAFLELSSVR